MVGSCTHGEDRAQSLPSIEVIGTEIDASGSASTIFDSNIAQRDNLVHDSERSTESPRAMFKPQLFAEPSADHEEDIEDTNVMGHSDGHASTSTATGMVESATSDHVPGGGRDDVPTESLGRAPLTKDEINMVKIACPIDWLWAGMDYMTSIHSAELLSRILRLWIRIQKHIGWPSRVGSGGQPTAHSLPSTHRPSVYSPWMKAHRKPKIPKSFHFDVDTFILQFRRWWSSFQPASRRTSVAWPLARDASLSNDWRAVARGGSLGLYLVTLGLAWQVAFTKEEDTSRQMVREHIDDVEWAYERILDTLTKLPPPDETEQPTKERKRGRDSNGKKSLRCEHCGCTGACKRRRM